MNFLTQLRKKSCFPATMPRESKPYENLPHLSSYYASDMGELCGILEINELSLIF
jgi:hypothetical protein